MNNLIKTDINGLFIRLNKVISDARGFLAEMMPGGAQNDFCRGGFKNLYLSVATQKGIARGGHFHKASDSFENFFCVSGLALWFFYDFRQETPTQNNFVIVIVGEKSIADKNLDPEVAKKTPHRYFLPEVMAQILVPPRVYHTYIPLTDEPVKIVATHSKEYDPADYERIELAKITDSAKVLAPFGIKISNS